VCVCKTCKTHLILLRKQYQELYGIFIRVSCASFMIKYKEGYESIC